MKSWMRGLAIKTYYKVDDAEIANWKWYLFDTEEKKVDWRGMYYIREQDDVPEFDELLREFGLKLPNNLCQLDMSPPEYFELLKVWAQKNGKDYNELVAKIKKPA